MTTTPAAATASAALAPSNTRDEQQQTAAQEGGENQDLATDPKCRNLRRQQFLTQLHANGREVPLARYCDIEFESVTIDERQLRAGQQGHW